MEESFVFSEWLETWIGTILIFGLDLLIAAILFILLDMHKRLKKMDQSIGIFVSLLGKGIEKKKELPVEVLPKKKRGRPPKIKNPTF